MSTPNKPTSASRSRPGRPRALDDAKLREIIALISAGFSVERAARYVDCAPSTIRREAIRNPKFNGELRKARLTAELSPLQAIREAARKSWRAGAWLLERIDPQYFGKQDVRHIKPDQLDAFVEIIGQIITDEVSSPDIRDRIAQKCEALLKAVERSVWINSDTPPARSRRKRRLPPDQGSADAERILAEIHQSVRGPADAPVAPPLADGSTP